MHVLIPTGGKPMIDKVESVVSGLDAVNIGQPESHSGSRFLKVRLEGNERDLNLALDRVVKLGGRLLS